MHVFANCKRTEFYIESEAGTEYFLQTTDV